MNWYGEGTIASALAAQPNANPVSGTPPTAPCSMTQVTAPARPSSSRMRGTSTEMPKPRFAALPAESSMAARRAMTFSASKAAGAKLSSGRRISPLIAGS